MTQFRIMLERLKNPSVVLSIASQMISVLLLLNVNVDRNIVTGIVTGSCTILVLLGIMSNPTAQNSGYGDDIVICSECGCKTVHAMINGQMVCTQCGNAHEEDV